MMGRLLAAEIEVLIANRVPVHMSGIGGVGMAGLALLLQARGVPVSGSDLQPGALVGDLRAKGITVEGGHSAGQVHEGIGWVIRSAAVQECQPDVQAAMKGGLPVFRRGEVLPVVLALAGCSIAVAGTHGKTTTSTLLAQLLGSLQPSWCIGGVSKGLPVPGGGGDGPLVVEADESDGTLALYAPHIAVVTNVDFDHMEHFASVEAFEACFATFIASARERVVYCADDARAGKLARAVGGKALGYGFSASSDVQGVLAEDGVLRVRFPGGAEASIGLPSTLPGVHNALNLLGAVAVCHAMGLASGHWQPRVAHLRLPARRFELLEQAGGIQVVSDYAHHPAEIAALVRMVQARHPGRVLAVFQPHRYTRTAALSKAFPPSFEGIHSLILTPVYAASENPVAGGSSEDMMRAFASAGVSYDTKLVGTLQEAAQAILGRVAPGDMVLIVGAGDVEKVGRMVADKIRGLYGKE
jgi:UDP-N-acetylmuramate--alanine ligase